jgi:hypothetical protein
MPYFSKLQITSSQTQALGNIEAATGRVKIFPVLEDSGSNFGREIAYLFIYLFIYSRIYFLICCLFSNAVSISDYKVSNDMMTNELAFMWTNVAHLPGETEENKEKPQNIRNLKLDLVPGPN